MNNQKPSFFKKLKNTFKRGTSHKKIKNPLEKFHLNDKNLVFNVRKNKKFGIVFPKLKQFKYISKVLSSGEKIAINTLSTIIIFTVIALGGYHYFYSSELIPAFGGEYTEALVGHPQFINPIISQTNNVDDDLARLIYSGLLKYNKNYEIENDIASGFEISEDQKTYTFHIRNNVTWHDGQQLDADDILFTVQTIQDPRYNSPLSLNFDGVSLEKVDDYTVKFILNEPYSPFLDSLTVGILPEHLWNNVPPSYFKLAEYNIKPIGTGPFKFDALTKDKIGGIRSMTLLNFENYYAQRPFIESLIFKFYPDFHSASDALFNKNVEGISKMPRDYYAKAVNSERLATYQFTLPQYTALFFNLKKKNIWASQEMRQALQYGLNKEFLINDILPNYAESIQGPLLEKVSAEGLTEIQNPQKALDIFEKNKWELNEEDGIRYKNNTPLTLTLTTIDQFDNFDVAEFLQKNYKELGVDVKLEIIPFNEIRERIKQRNYDALLFGQLIGNDLDPYPFWHSTQRTYPGLNLSMYANKKVDKLIEEARTTLDITKRKELYQNFQDVLLEELPAIFLYKPIYNYSVNKRINNITGSQMVRPSDRFITINEWFIKTKHSFTQ